MMFLFGLNCPLNAQVPIVIGSGETHSSYLPIEEDYKFSISQQIYTADELTITSGTITGVAFKMANSTYLNRNVNVYMINTDKESFSDVQDWVDLSTDDMVYSGGVLYPGVVGEWASIDLQTPFTYTGGNVLICVHDVTGYFAEDNAKFATYSVGSSPRSLNKFSMQYVYDPTDMGDVYGNYEGSDPYYNNQIKFTVILDGDDNPITVTPNPINIGERPVGAWMRPYEVKISSNVASLNITSIQSSNPFFTLTGAETPVEVPFGQPLYIGVSHGAGNGSMTGQLTVTYGGSQTEVVEMTGSAYNPSSPDVWELAENVSVYPHLAMPTFSDLHNNYNLPFGGNAGVDAVYKLVFASDVTMTATATGNDAKVVLYEEGFQGKGGPDVDNYYQLQTSSVITDMLVPAGTYYLVASATSSFMVFIETESVPAPSKAYNPTPANGATEVANPTLSWEFGSNTMEYQLLLDTQNPPQSVAVAWTDNLQSTYNPGQLSSNETYYWRVNARNTSGTTNGDVWSFSTPYDAPTGLYAIFDKIYEGDGVSLSWYPVEGSDGYNIYSNGTKVNTNLINNTSYVLNGLTYNMSGYNITATAVYGNVESAHSAAVKIYVSGKGNVSGKVYEVDGNTPVAGGTVKFVGTDEFGSNQTCTLNVNNNGSYSGQVYVGNYTVTASAAGYQDVSLEMNVAYGQTNNMDFVLYENYYPVNEVIATLLNESSVKVEWDIDRVLVGYNVYRRNFHLDDAHMIAEDVTSTSYTDNKWGDLDAGAYQWGVAAVYEGNRIEKLIYREDFEKGAMPQGWTIYEEPESEYYITDWAVKKEAYNYYPYDGEYAAYSTGSPSTSVYYMVTDAFDLSICKNAELRFYYIAPAWDTDVNVLKVKVGTSPDGPWTEVWSSNEADVPSWTEASVDISDHVAKETYIAFVNENHYGYCVGIDNIEIIDNSTESTIVWSNKVDKGMTTTMTVTAETNNDDPVEGTTVYFSNIGEGSYNYSVTLDETGTHTWNDFRKGKYELTISKDGFNSSHDGVIVDIWEETEIECVLTEILAPVENLYVSPTGWVMWDVNGSKELLSYDIKLNGILQEEVTTNYYQHDIDAFAFEEGEVYTTTVIANYSSGSSAPVKCSWTFAECDNFEGATNLILENNDGDNVLSWTMPDVDNENEYDGDEMFYDDGVNVDGVGRYSGGTFYWGIMFTAQDLAPFVGQKILKVSTFDYANHDGEIQIYLGGEFSPGNLVHTQNYYCAGSKTYVDFELTQSITISNENIWIIFHNHNGQYIAPAGANTGNPNGRWISEDGIEWFDMYTDIEWDYTWNIRAYVNYEGEYPGMEKDVIGTMIYRDGELITAEPIVGNTFTDESPVAGTEYSVRVVHGGLPNKTYYSMSCEAHVVSVEENQTYAAAVYPNPVTDNLNIVAEGMQRITVINAVGQIVLDKNVGSDNEIVDMSEYEAGFYLVRITTEAGVAVKRIIVVK